MKHISLLINGKTQTLPAQTSLSNLLQQLGMQGSEGIAVSINGQIINQSHWHSTQPRHGDQLEIVQATMGG